MAARSLRGLTLAFLLRHLQAVKPAASRGSADIRASVDRAGSVSLLDPDSEEDELEVLEPEPHEATKLERMRNTLHIDMPPWGSSDPKIGCFQGQHFLVGPAYAPQMLDELMSAPLIYDGHPFTYDVRYSRIDNLDASYCGALYLNDIADAGKGYRDPRDTCSITYNLGTDFWITSIVTAGRNDAAPTWVSRFAYYISFDGMNFAGPYPKVNGSSGFAGNINPVDSNVFTLPGRQAARFLMLVGLEASSTSPSEPNAAIRRCCFRADLVGCGTPVTTTTTTTTNTSTTTTTTIARTTDPRRHQVKVVVMPQTTSTTTTQKPNNTTSEPTAKSWSQSRFPLQTTMLVLTMLTLKSLWHLR